MLADWQARRGSGFFEAIRELDWQLFRSETLSMDPEREEARVRRHIQSVEAQTGVELRGEALLFGSFGMMDGYARFDQGSHLVYLGVDESFKHPSYLDVLITHELTHVARETQGSVWAGHGLPLVCSHDQFTENQPVIEHLFGEGFSCTVSEILNPGLSPWLYAYQTEAGWDQIRNSAQAIDKRIREELKLGLEGDYGRLYNTGLYSDPVPLYSHYVWAWQWVKSIVARVGRGHPKELVSRCSAEWLPDAMTFSLVDALTGDKP